MSQPTNNSDPQPKSISTLLTVVVSLMIGFSLGLSFANKTSSSSLGLTTTTLEQNAVRDGNQEAASYLRTQQPCTLDNPTQHDSDSIDSEYGKESDSGNDIVASTTTTTAPEVFENCLDPNGPQPYILLTRGRSGSGSTWQIIGNLTGYETPNDRPTGGTHTESKKFFQNKNDDEWLYDIFCTRQRKYPEAGIIGFKWKPFEEFFTEPSISALKTIGVMNNPQIKVVRSRRNLLDVIISSYKHKIYDSTVTAQHCHVSDEECAKKAKEASMGLQLPTKKLLDKLKRDRDIEAKVDKLLEDNNVPHVQVTYEELYYGKDGGVGEWMKVFNFLGKGPGEGLTTEQLHGAMEHVATNIPMHNVTLGNYEEVKEILKETEFESLLH